GAYQVGNSNFAALWLWHRTNIYNPSASVTVTGSVPLDGLPVGHYQAEWWDTFAGAPLTNFAFDVTDTNLARLAIPPVLRSTALFVGPPPKGEASAPALVQTLASNSTASTLPLMITNSGGLPLTYSISITGATPVMYRATDSTQSAGPVFAWKDISSVGRDITGSFVPLTGLSARDEGIAGPIDIGFPFPFFSGGQAPDLFTQLYVSPNGFVTFSPFTGATAANQPLPSSSAPSNCIAFFWRNFDLTAAGRVYCDTDPLGGKFILQFQDVPIPLTATTLTCQLILKSSGEILMVYKTIGTPGAYTVGVQDGAALHGLQVAYNQSYLQDGLAVSLSPVPWLSVSKNAGVVPRGASEVVMLAFDPTRVPIGTYGATLSLTTGDPGFSTRQMPVSLTVLTPFDQWRWTHFSTTDNNGPAADNADPDNDGLVNLVEYALGLDPKVADRQPLSAVIEQGHLTLSYRRPYPAPTDVIYLPEVSETLDAPAWSSGPSYTSQVVVDNGDGTGTVVVTDLADTTVASAHFLRLRISR
ncbi:MAG TPA: hypothetical protein VHI52_18630, partial [Verrucomicrobiae bacterium]|nr:hypothetical protein [Verrucomicrobiae bacterium]